MRSSDDSKSEARDAEDPDTAVGDASEDSDGSDEDSGDEKESGDEDDSASDDEGSESETGSVLNLALAEDGRVAAPLLPFLHLDGFKSWPKFIDVGGDGGDGGDDEGKSKFNHLLDDCRSVFTARAKTKKGPYSSGKTYWLSADTSPRCALEEIARKVFEFHTKIAVEEYEKAYNNNMNVASCSSHEQEMPPPFDLSRSGAEWWTQCIDGGDEIGMHWDKDYALEQSDLNIHPQIGTVTYFSGHGAPTLMVRKRTPVYFSESVAGGFDDFQTSFMGNYSDSSRQVPQHTDCDAFLSYPAIGKHVSFDGSWLHGALPELAGKRKTHKKESTTRVTFLVNVWLNHVPSTAVPLPEGVLSGLSPVGAFGGALDETDTATNDAVAEVDVAAVPTDFQISRVFKHADKDFLMSFDVPEQWFSKGVDIDSTSNSFALKGTNGTVGEVKETQPTKGMKRKK